VWNNDRLSGSGANQLEPCESLPFDDLAAEHYARVRRTLEARGTPIGERDLIIASLALAHDLVVVTSNTCEFGRVEGLVLEDWSRRWRERGEGCGLTARLHS
jgi:predicted nucleic acid-binding protein